MAVTDPIQVDGKFIAVCACGKSSAYATKHSAVVMIGRGNCRYCTRYVKVPYGLNIYLNSSNKWCSTCSGCGKEQAYTRKDHAKQSEVADWQCKKCVSSAKKYGINRSVGNKQRLYNKYKKSACSRGIDWDLTLDDMFENYTGACALTKWEICMEYGNSSASLDRIDSTKGYTKGNIQWVHSMVNMCKNKYSQDDFVAMCVAIAAREKW